MRALRKQPAVTLAVVLTLALGIGTTTAIFTVVEGVLLRPLPYPDEGYIVRVAATGSGGRNQSFSPRGYFHFVKNNRSFAKFGGALGVLPYPLTGSGPPVQINTGLIT